MRVAICAIVMLFVAEHAGTQSCLPDPSQCGGADWVSGCSPIVINFSSGDYRLTGANSPVIFDIHGTGQPVRIGWTASGADEAFLCLDIDRNGKIDSGAELLGNAMPLKNGTHAPNGFVVLAQFDDNHDGIIDEQDAIWGQLLLWCDLNHDGISQPYELTPVAGSRLTAINLKYHWTGRRDAFGNGFRYESEVWIQGVANQVAQRPVYDLFFVGVP